jgi:RTX calcium-binding nonapeptide repeat (4 copies)
VEGGPNRDAVIGDGGSDVVQAGRGRDPCVATEDGVAGNDVANGGAGRDVYQADDGDVLVLVEQPGTCASTGG